MVGISVMSEKEKNQNLIALLETEMQKDLQSINIDAEHETTIDIEIVFNWYTEAEKLIRVLANILNVPMTQSINQLRYAGHHILKAQQPSATVEEKKQNLIESYKHCKRAVYDALDFYVYKLNEYYRVLLPLLKSQDAIKAESLLKTHIVEINQCRSECGTRINYYSKIQDSLVAGLTLVEKLNEIQREAGIVEDFFKEKSHLCAEISVLKHHIKDLQDNIELRKEKESSNSDKLALLIAIIIALGTFGGLIADTFTPSYHEIVFSQKQQELTSPVPLLKK